MPRPNSGNERYNVFLPPKHIAAMKKLAKLDGTTVSEIIREAIRRDLIRRVEEKKRIQQQDQPGDSA